MAVIARQPQALTVFDLDPDLERFGIGFGLDRTGAVFAEAGRRGVAVLEELEVGDLAVDDFDPDGEREATTCSSDFVL
jgi:hypothetical protein